MSRLVMGNIPSTNISVVAVKETAKMKDYPIRYPVAFQALTYDSYVDNTFLNAPDHVVINANIEETNLVAAKGGGLFLVSLFHIKIFS